jgi:hypothetical protein
MNTQTLKKIAYQFQYNTGKNMVTFMVSKADEKDNAYHVYIEEDESIAEFYAVPHEKENKKSLTIYRAVTDLPIWLHAGNVLALLMLEIDRVMR